jgi:hypothetical protein
MRQAINENPRVQIIVVGVLLVAVAFMLLTRVMGGSSGSEATAPPPGATGSAAAGVPAAGAPAGTPAPTGVTPTASTTPAPAAPTAGASPTTVPTGDVSPEALKPGPGLPAPVVAAWERGDAVVLLIVKNGGTDDQLVRASVETLSKPGVTVFVETADKIARYSRITQGVGVNRVPALIVLRPKRVSGPVPQAVVSYGFRNSRSVVQAVNDALYEGPDDLPYSPR